MKVIQKLVRLFGSAIFFDEQDDDLSAAFRAISCGQLIRSVQREVREKMDLSIQIRMAADLCQMETEGKAKTFMARSISKLVLTNYSSNAKKVRKSWCLVKAFSGFRCQKNARTF